MRYLIVDTANTFFRARHSAFRGADTWTKLGFAIHVTLSSINKVWRDQKADHAVFCLEGRSWRKDYYEPYKKNRADARAALNEAEAEEDKLFWEAYDDLTGFVRDRSNCTVLRHPNLEADDLIAGWIQSHPNDDHIIVSNDSDFYQLLSKNVRQYNGVASELYTLEGVFNDKGKPVIDKKTKEPKVLPNPEWLLFEKCMRGDSSDNVFSAYPGVRTKGTKNKIGLQEAFEDRASKGFNWNNLMLQRWVDHNEEEHRVLDDYERNRILIDLTAQPIEVKEMIASTIAEASVPKQISQVGTKFLKFCGKYELNRISDQAQQYAELLSAEYKQ